jgi:hypothetical protein
MPRVQQPASAGGRDCRSDEISRDSGLARWWIASANLMLQRSLSKTFRWRYWLLGVIALPVFGGLYYALIDYLLFG